MTIARIDIGLFGEMLAKNLADLRTSRRMPYTELARRLADLGRPIPVLGLRRIERGERRVDVDDLAAFALVFELANPWSLAQVGACITCADSPPAGFRCVTCGTGGAA